MLSKHGAWDETHANLYNGPEYPTQNEVEGFVGLATLVKDEL